jgi:hypothetical protein
MHRDSDTLRDAAAGGRIDGKPFPFASNDMIAFAIDALGNCLELTNTALIPAAGPSRYDRRSI